VGGRNAYRINREHTALKVLLEALPGHDKEIATLLRLLEETVPVERIWLDNADDPHNAAIPYDNVDLNELKQDMRRVRDLLVAKGVTKKMATESLKDIVPFDRYPTLINEL
jgi:hypothetical protein